MSDMKLVYKINKKSLLSLPLTVLYDGPESVCYASTCYFSLCLSLPSPGLARKRVLCIDQRPLPLALTTPDLGLSHEYKGSFSEKPESNVDNSGLDPISSLLYTIDDTASQDRARQLQNILVSKTCLPSGSK